MAVSLEWRTSIIILPSRVFDFTLNDFCPFWPAENSYDSQSFQKRFVHRSVCPSWPQVKQYVHSLIRLTCTASNKTFFPAIRRWQLHSKQPPKTSRLKSRNMIEVRKLQPSIALGKDGDACRSKAFRQATKHCRLQWTMWFAPSFEMSRFFSPQ